MSQNFAHTTSGIISCNISDHQPYFICLDYLKLKNVDTQKYIKITRYSETAISDLVAYLRDADIISKLRTDVSVNENYSTLINFIEVGLEKFVPIKKVKFDKHKHKKSKWITRGIIKSIAFRDKLYMRLKSTPDNIPLHDQLKANLQSYNLTLKKLIRSAKTTYYQHQFTKFKNDMKNTWVTIKDIMNKNKNESTMPEHFFIQNEKVSNKQAIVNNFNSYFSNIGPELASNISPPPNKHFSDFLQNPFPNDFTFNNVTEAIVIKTIDSLKSKTSAGYDRLSNVLLKKIKAPLITPLVFIINQSLNSGVFPDLLKIAKVLPVYKKEDKHSLSNYRPISILPAISKIFEKIIFNQLHTFFHVNKLYNKNQYGFRESHSTEHAALELVDRVITQLDNSKLPLAIFIDLSKAFDTINHEILLHKLNHYGIRNTSLSLLKSYLTNRKQFVEIDDVQSPLTDITTGVPQGSILGPLLFIIYINDISLASDLFKTITYADDTTLFISVSVTAYECEPSTPVLNFELNKYIDWLKLNALSLNVDKTKCIMFSSPNKTVQPPPIKLNDNFIEYVSKFNFLGVTIDKHVKWTDHIEKISSKVSKVVGILCYLKKTLPTEILKLIYNSLINPHFHYGILCWGTQHHRITKLQKKAIRIITNSRYNAHTQPLFKQLRILTISHLYDSKLLRFYYRFANNLLPEYFSSFHIIRQCDTHNRYTRSNSFVTPRINHKLPRIASDTDCPCC